MIDKRVNSSGDCFFAVFSGDMVLNFMRGRVTKDKTTPTTHQKKDQHLKKQPEPCDHEKISK